MENNKYYTVKELAKKASVCTKTIQRLKDEDGIVVKYDGKKILISKESADKWLENRIGKSTKGRKRAGADKQSQGINKYAGEYDRSKNDATKSSDCEQTYLQFSVEENRNLDSIFKKQLATAGFEVDEKGIFVNGQKGKEYVTNFKGIEYLYNKQINGYKTRVLRFDSTVI
ncbi:MAG: helix-turn-helix domain-containing protein, partial [Candidatus Tenebribacter davisii]|nr:helix-turn-helix domain-containing protein [Candidatus Tenebribacter davisii]